MLLVCATVASHTEPNTLRATLTESANLTFTYDPAVDESHTETPRLSDIAPPAFGEGHSYRWHLSAGSAIDVTNADNRLYQSGFGITYFFVDNLSIVAEVNAIYFDQSGKDALGGNINLTFRHHFVIRDTWSLYADAGAGLLGTSKRVPQDGSHFNFVPHAGLGVSFDLGDDARLFLGARWHHISNANTHRNNPGRDSVLGYAELSFPF